jgi:hypothetical protein
VLGSDVLLYINTLVQSLFPPGLCATTVHLQVPAWYLLVNQSLKSFDLPALL